MIFARTLAKLVILGSLACALLTPASPQPTLKEAFKGGFLIGAAINPSQFSEQDTRAAEIIKTQFNTISPENALKWQSVHPK
ncbi:MAG: endo-1,4-beta-xylanase, partial [Blastocatellia bacterium]